ncbi:MAG: HEPN domain-containing protein [Ignavibacteria bacterium CG22_combo_CG10-13_8_21_14_all_37_15]|nr:MAG: HEPN domain-containing protein [Ignavibacteria bacterium CG22_combo_CG10-13_8_21_14_all_37_15]PJC61039.1 MAG: HEPN domain-containing protein [Ignavibacteria bacterium CG_4_9_14_0_2_um_filter_37_13]
MDNFSANLVKYRIEKAADELELAQYCIEVHKFSKSLNCSYYAIFHSARALLAIENLDFKKHSGVISHFIKAYINTTIFDNELGVIIRTAERERNKGDYQDFYVVSKDEAITQFNSAEMFFNKIKTYLEEHYEMTL